MSDHYKVGMNKTSLPDALWFIYMIYLKGYGPDFKEAVRLYENDLRDPFCFIPPYKEEIEGMEFIKRYLIQDEQKPNQVVHMDIKSGRESQSGKSSRWSVWYRAFKGRAGKLLR